MEDIKLKKYNNEDYEFVYEVKKISYKKYVIEYWGNWDEELQRNYFDNFIEQEKETSYIIQYGDKNIGFYNGKLIDSETYEIGNICIMPDNQGNGIGTKILKGIIDKYENKDIVLQFFKSNPVGNLYKRLGFEKTGETDFHYQMKKLRNKK